MAGNKVAFSAQEVCLQTMLSHDTGPDAWNFARVQKLGSHGPLLLHSKVIQAVLAAYNCHGTLS